MVTASSQSEIKPQFPYFAFSVVHLGILTSHPIQYQAPWFRALARECDLEVFFAHRQSASEQGQAGFGVAFDWDVDLLSGYKHRFLRNISTKPSVNHYCGCDTPEIANIISRNSERFDAFIVNGWYLKAYMQAVRACRRTGIPVLVRGDSQLRTPRSALKRLGMEVRQRWLLRQFDAFLSVGQRHREYLEHFGVPSEKIFFAPHFVDNGWFAAKAAEVRGQRSEIRRQWNIPEAAFCVLFCGKFIPKKRPLDLVEAARLLQAPDSKLLAPKVHLLFVGSGELGPQLRAATNLVFDAERSVSQPSTLNPQLPAASFAGFLNQTEIARAYVAADVLALPSDGGETWGLVVNEAIACGTPAIISDAVGCGPDLIAPGETGFTFALGDIDVLADRMAKLMSLRCRGHDFAPALMSKLSRYNLEAAVQGTLQAVPAGGNQISF